MHSLQWNWCVHGDGTPPIPQLPVLLVERRASRIFEKTNPCHGGCLSRDNPGQWRGSSGMHNYLWAWPRSDTRQSPCLLPLPRWHVWRRLPQVHHVWYAAPRVQVLLLHWHQYTHTALMAGVPQSRPQPRGFSPDLARGTSECFALDSRFAAAAGSVSGAGQTSCGSRCPAGLGQAFPGSLQCTSCAPGSYSDGSTLTCTAWYGQQMN